MKNLKRNNSFKDWKKVSQLYVNWVAKTSLRKYFSQNFLVDDLSVWWITDICNKDNVIKNDWFVNLKLLLIQKKIIKNNLFKFYLFFVLKFLKNFLIDLLWYSFIKILSFSRYKKIDKENCFHSLNYNFLKHKNEFIDRCYGTAIKKNLSKNFYLINIIKKKNFILDLFKQKKYFKNLPILIADENISVFDVVKVYFKSLLIFLKLIFLFNKKKDFFIINNVNCGEILKPLLLMSFAGGVQKSLLIGKSIQNSIIDKKIKSFVNYAEFNPFMRSIYFFIKKIKLPPKIFTIQHGAANKNLLFFFHKRNEFTTNKKNEGKFFSPSPDVYLVQGQYFKDILKSYFPKKIFIIGSLKYDTLQLIQKKKNSLFNLKRKNKKILLICPSIGDEKLILSFFEKCYSSNYRLILSPHPTYKKEILSKFREKLNKKFEIEFYDEYSTNDLLSISNLVVCSMSTIGYEALFHNIISVRIIDDSLPPFFNDEDNLPLINNFSELDDILNERTKYKFSNKDFLNVKKRYFYKLDKKAHLRFWALIKKI